MNKKKTLIAVLAIALLVGLVSAGLLSYYGRIVTTANIGQSVLLDGKDITGMPIAETIEAFGGCRYCYKHTLNNRACEPERVVFDTTYSPLLTDDEIKTRIYDLSPHIITITEGYEGYGGELFDFTKVETIDSTEYFGWDPLIITKNHDMECNVVFTIVAPEGIDETPENFGMPFDTDCDGVMDWQIQYHADPASEDRDFRWAYSPMVDTDGDGVVDTYKKDVGAPPRNWDPLPSWIEATKDGKTFTIKIDSDKLGNNNGKADDCGLSYRFGLFMVENDDGYPESWSGEAAIIVYPDPGFDWFESSGLEEETLGTLVTTTLTIPSESTVIFCICYKFAVNISPGTYTIKTEIKPA